MNTKSIWLTILAVLLSFFGGFLLANSLNRTDLNTLRAENESLKKGVDPNQTGSTKTDLSDEEIRQSIARADQNPENLDLQKNLGLALYRYAASNQDPGLMPDVARLLMRVYEKNPKDLDTAATLGNVYFDIGYFKKENDKLVKSREFYEAVLKEKPDNVDVRTDYGLTFYLTDPPETDRAVAEYNKSLEYNPRHEKTLQVIIQALLSLQRQAEAKNYLTRLEEVNPNNPFLPELKNQFTNGGSQNQ